MSTDPSPWGDAIVGTTGVCIVSLYLVSAFLFLIFSLARVWPPIALCTEGAPAAGASGPAKPGEKPAQARTGAANASSANQAEEKPAEAEKGAPGRPASGKEPQEPVQAGAGTGTKAGISDPTLLCLVAIVGALGAIIHAMRSFYAFVGNGQFKYCWLPMYVLLPCIGSALALIFFLILKGILSSGAPAGVSYNTTLGYLAVAGIVGLFTEETTVKIQEVAQSILGKKQDQKDPLTPTPPPGKPGANPGATGS